MAKSRKRTIIVKNANMEFLPPQPLIIGTMDRLPKGTDAMMRIHEDELDVFLALTISDVEGMISDLTAVHQWLMDRLAGRVQLPIIPDKFVH